LLGTSSWLLLGTGASNQMKLIQDMLEAYDRKAKPTWDNNKASEDGKKAIGENSKHFQPVNVTFSMDLYQILELVNS
jgi:hypothetical protein